MLIQLHMRAIFDQPKKFACRLDDGLPIAQHLGRDKHEMDVMQVVTQWVNSSGTPLDDLGLVHGNRLLVCRERILVAADAIMDMGQHVDDMAGTRHEFAKTFRVRAAWARFSAFATFAQRGLHAAALVSPMTVATPVLGRVPLIAFLMTHWRDGAGGAFTMSLQHGLYRLGCCCLLMALLFVLGVINLLWLAALSVVMLLEKTVPVELWIVRGSGLLVILWGSVLLASGIQI